MEGEAGVVDPVSTVSSRIALLPANVCHVWHTRRTQPRACARGLRDACKSTRVRTCALLSCVTFAASRTREFILMSYSDASRYHVSRCCAERTHTIPTRILSYEGRQSGEKI